MTFDSVAKVCVWSKPDNKVTIKIGDAHCFFRVHTWTWKNILSNSDFDTTKVRHSQVINTTVHVIYFLKLKEEGIFCRS